MRGDPSGVKGYEDVDCRSRLRRRFGCKSICKIRSECGAEQGRYVSRGPLGCHAIWEFSVNLVLEDESYGEVNLQETMITYGLSTTKTSSSCRSPKVIPLLTSSFFLVSPSPSASPFCLSVFPPVLGWVETYHYSNTRS